MNWASLLAGASLAAASAAAGLQAIRALAAHRAWKLIRARADEFSPLAIDDAASGESTRGVSILLPVSGSERDLILECVRNCLAVRHPRCELLVVCEGRGTADALGLTREFDLAESRRLHPRRLGARPATRMLASRTRAQLIVVEHDGVGRANALNTALEMARHPLVCAIDASTRLEKDALLRASGPMVEDEAVLAVEGMMLASGAGPGAPAPLRGVVQRVGAVEQLRYCFLGQAAAASFGAPAWLSSSFGMYRRDIVLALGGWTAGCEDPDAELGARLHRLAAPPMKGSLAFLAEPMGWRVCPNSVSSLFSLWRHQTRAAWDLRRRGLSATASMRAAWRTMGWIGWSLAAAIAIAAAAGVVAVQPLAWLAALYLVLGLIVSLSVLSTESMLKSRTERLLDRVLLMAASVARELLRPIAALVQLHTLLLMRRKTEAPVDPQPLQSRVPRPALPAAADASIISAGAAVGATQFDHPPARDA